MTNDTPIFRFDYMPYGGNIRSGLGLEGRALRHGGDDQHQDGGDQPKMSGVSKRDIDHGRLIGESQSTTALCWHLEK
jgi:hypothetical protein